MAVQHIGPAAQRFVDRRLPYDLNHNLALIKVAPAADGGLPTRDEIAAQIGRRLHFMPRLRQRLVFPPLGIGRAFLADDPHFDLDNHIGVIDGERIAEHRAQQILGTMLERPLARNRPLWEVWLIYGLADGSMLVVAKAHHLIVDGVLGWQTLAAVLLDLEREGQRFEAEPWAPAPLPDRPAAAREAAKHLARRAGKHVAELARSARERERLGVELGSLRALPRTLRDELRPAAPALPINADVGMHRVATWLAVPMHEVREVADAAPQHVTINDVILAIVSEGLRNQLRAMGAPAPLPSARVMVPISAMRRTGGRVAFDQRDSFMVIDLDLAEPDVARRLATIRSETVDRKGREATAVEAILEVVFALPATERNIAWTMLAGARVHNLVLSNIQGIDHALYLRGHEVQELAALASLPKGHGLRIVAISAQDQLTFGITVDPNTIRDHEPLRLGMVDGLAALRAGARALS